MKLTPKTLVLLAISVLLAALNLAGGRTVAQEALPVLPTVAPDRVTRVEISTPVQKLTMERLSADKTSPDHGRWRIVTPLEFPADAAQIRSVLREFGPGVPMEAQVDEGNLEDYGLDNENGLLVELFTGETVPALSVVVGKPAAGPTSFVRIPGDDHVYRADVGARARLGRPAADWRDRVALELDRAAVTDLVVERGAETLRFSRGPSQDKDKKGNPIPGPWTMRDAPFPVDSDTVEALVKALTHVRAGEIHNPDYDGGFDAPAARATLTMEDGSAHTVVLGGRPVEGGAFVKVDDRPEVFRIAAPLARQLGAPIASLRDRSVLSFDRDDVESVALQDGGLTIVLAQDMDGRTWTVTQPPNMDADQKQAQFMVNTLATLRAAGIPGDDVFAPSGAKLVLRYRDGRTETLELGQDDRDAQNQPMVRVRVSGKPGLYQVKEATITELKRAFGRA